MYSYHPAFSGVVGLPHQRRASRIHRRILHVGKRQLDSTAQQRRGNGLQAPFFPLVHSLRIGRIRKSYGSHLPNSLGHSPHRHDSMRIRLFCKEERRQNGPDNFFHHANQFRTPSCGSQLPGGYAFDGPHRLGSLSALPMV